MTLIDFEELGKLDLDTTVASSNKAAVLIRVYSGKPKPGALQCTQLGKP